ncbi:MAG: hypothetical protein FJX75_27460 [Armatimonadetes bacterium]|nr:hypothetical protein [Armatimonadota bacterium]
MTPSGATARRSLLSRLLLLTAFGIAFGHIEAVVVVYIRRIMDWVPLPADIGAEDVGRIPNWLIHTEQTREAATIIVLLALATLVGRNFLERLATFLFAFGVWDLTYYGALKVMIRWPESFATQDCLFLIPSPWLAPVWIPMVASVGMIAVAVGIMAAIERRSASRT